MTPFLNLTGIRRLPLIRQTEAAECGLACLAMVAGWHGYDIDLNSLRRRFPISLKGVTMKELVELAARIGLGTRAVRLEVPQLKSLRMPAILHWEMKHFVVLKRARGDRIEVYDPASGRRILHRAEISTQAGPSAGYSFESLALDARHRIGPNAGVCAIAHPRNFCCC